MYDVYVMLSPNRNTIFFPEKVRLVYVRDKINMDFVSLVFFQHIYSYIQIIYEPILYIKRVTVTIRTTIAQFKVS